ncbi:C6 zinc finger domain protein [Akanthomyces lecanii RCEF 1005]|uniref:C6 zinc finger domain protein n=1 Tax=Akanthomyces lecanii RCEF 1005 TaxID=1081108 RepID=A0A168BFY5_CORDF|nr:C6 zinc finger domain protein [Akanthomyces lecanii RCEF 1005]
MNWAIKNGFPRLGLYHPHAIIDFDIIVEGFLWQAHMNSRFADMDCCGDPGVILKEVKSNSPSAMLMYPYHYCYSIFDCGLTSYRNKLCIRCNTTSPDHRQVLGYYRYTDDQIRAVLERFLCLKMPCPAELLLFIVQITRLRVGVATKPRHPNAAASRTKAVFEKADDFDLDIWVEESPLFTKTFVKYYGEISQLAVKLYGILTLPPSAFLRVYPNAFEAYSLRTLLRQKLAAILKDLYHKL